jgi:NADH pyrophosphatase NudC (nudix superfamily)
LISDERWWFLIWEGIDSAHLLPTEISNEIVTQCKIHDCAYNPKTGCPLCNSIIEKRHPLKPDQLPPIAHIKPGFKLYSGCYWEKLPKDYLITSKIKTMTDDGGIWAIVLPEKALYTAKEWQSIKDSLKHLYETEPPDVVKQREKLLENVKRNEDLKRGANQTNLVKDPSKSIQASAEETKKPRSDTCDLFCPYCGKPIEVDEKATFCPNCGKKLLSSTNPGMKFCPKCGNNLGERPQGTFCSKCGADLKRLLS